MSSLRLPSPAKLNLFLHITGRREDGYHELQTLFQLLDYGDTIELTSTGDDSIRLDCPGLVLAVEDNLAWRAAHLLREHSDCTQGVAIHIDKRIPSGGGLGGGSSNAATVLLGLNRLWRLKLPLRELAEIGLTLGADVPVFLRGDSAWAEGIGEILAPVDLPVKHYLVIAPDTSISTAEVFSRRELTRNTSPITIAAFFEGGGRNDCQNVVRQLYPEVDKALIWLEKFGQAQLTGTGACVFAVCETSAEAEALYHQLPGDWQGFVAAGVNRSPVHRALG